MPIRPQDRADRRDLLLRRLGDAPGITAATRAEEFGTGVRTIFRDLEALRERGYPIESSRGRGGGLRLAPRWGLGRVLLARDEALGALLAMATAEQLRPPMFADDLARARRRLLDAFPTSERRRLALLRQRVYVGSPASAAVAESWLEPRRSVMRALHIAFVETRVVDIMYRQAEGRDTQRTIEPHVILVNWPVWYRVAHDHLRDDVRTFRFDRILTVTVFLPCAQQMIDCATAGVAGLEPL